MSRTSSGHWRTLSVRQISSTERSGQHVARTSEARATSRPARRAGPGERATCRPVGGRIPGRQDGSDLRRARRRAAARSERLPTMAEWGRSHGRGYDPGRPTPGFGSEGLAGRRWARHRSRAPCPMALPVEQRRVPTAWSEPWALSLRTTVQLPTPSRLISWAPGSPVGTSPLMPFNARTTTIMWDSVHWIGSRIRADHPLRGGLGGETGWHRWRRICRLLGSQRRTPWTQTSIS